MTQERAGRRAKTTRPGQTVKGIVSDAGPDLTRLSLEKLHDHPANPDPTEQEVLQMTEWLLERGQDEAITVRPHPEVIGHHEVLAGKTRLAAARRLGWDDLEARVRDDLADEAAAVAFMAASNAQRRTESPVRQALMIEAMFARGMTLKQAGAVYGLDSEAGARNKLQLLKLPEPWRERVISGEMAESIARCVVPWVSYPQLLKALDQDFCQCRRVQWRHGWDTRDNAARTVRRVVEERTRPIDKREKHDYGWQLRHWHPRYFALTDDLEQKLQVVELPLGKNGKLIKRALNAKAYDKLQIPLIKERLEKADSRSKKSGQSAGGKKPTAADEKRKRAEQTQQVARKVESWRHAFLRLLIAEAIKPGDWRTTMLLPWAMATQQGGYRAAPLRDLVVHAGRGQRPDWAGASEALSAALSTINEVDDPITDAENLQAQLLSWLFWPQDDQAEEGDVVGPELPEVLPPIEPACVEEVAGLWELRIRDGWIRGATQRTLQRDMIERFLKFHFRWQLEDLAGELGVDVSAAETKSAAVKAILDAHCSNKPLKMPKSIDKAAVKPKGRRHK